MRAVVFIPDCCGRAKLVADLIKLPVGAKAMLDKHLCGNVDPNTAIKEVVRLCKRADGRRAMFGWTLIVEDCKWEDVEDIVAEAGGDVVYMR
jgi:hypothetical protein